METLSVTADFAVNGIAAGENLWPKFHSLTPGVWELRIHEPIKRLPQSRVAFSIKDKQGNGSRITRTFIIRKDGHSASN
jgi:hypothetical protein